MNKNLKMSFKFSKNMFLKNFPKFSIKNPGCFVKITKINSFNRFPIYKFSSNNQDKRKDEIPEEMKHGVNYQDNNIQRQQEIYDSDSEDGASFYNKRKKLYYLLTISATIITGVLVGLHLMKPDEKIPSKRRMGDVTYVGKAQIGGPWKLYDTAGNPVNHKDFSGKYYLIYFGFTQCPDVCPMSLQKIAKVLNQIKKSKEYKYFDLECIFVSVDPDRDTADRIKNYCKLFDDKIIGLTSLSNDHPELKDMLKRFKIHSSKIYLSKEDEEEDKKNLLKNVPELVNSMESYKPKIDAKYSLDHTIVTYLMGPNNNFVTYLSSNLNTEEMYNIVVDEIMNDLTSQIKTIPIEKR